MEEGREYKDTVQKLFAFIEESPSQYHAVDTMRKHLEAAGYEQLFRERSVEAEIRWEILCDPQWFITHCISNSGAGFSELLWVPDCGVP